MSNLRLICRPHTVFCCCKSVVRVRVSVGKNFNLPSRPSVSVFTSSSPFLGADSLLGKESWRGRWNLNQHRRMAVKASSNWADSKSPYQILGNLFWEVFFTKCWYWYFILKSMSSYIKIFMLLYFSFLFLYFVSVLSIAIACFLCSAHNMIVVWGKICMAERRMTLSFWFLL